MKVLNSVHLVHRLISRVEVRDLRLERSSLRVIF